jgi:hypothetical protein
MKRINHSAGALALILGAALCTFTPGMAAQSGDKAQQPGQQQPGQQQQAQQENKTFTGKIQKLPSGQYALVTGQTADGKLSGHLLDDQENAKKYDGQQVKITGTFDTASNLIHVTNIQAA